PALLHGRQPAVLPLRGDEAEAAQGRRVRGCSQAAGGDDQPGPRDGDVHLRRAAFVACAALVLAPSAFAGTGGTGPGSAARLQGIWSMSGKVTRADNVRGERKGQRVKRTW